MKILRMDRCKGKTTELIKLANRKWLYIIVSNHSRAQLLNNKAREMGLDIPYPITLDELPIRSPYIKKVLIDDMDEIIQALVGRPVEVATVSCEVESK